MEDSTRVVDGPKLEEEQDVAEAEMWEGSHEKIPKLLQPNYASVIGDFNLNTRIRIYKVLDVFNWRFNPCELVLKVLLHINARDNILALLKIFEMVDSTSLHNTLCLLLRMDYARIEEFLYDTPHSDLLKLLDVVSFINKKEFELLHDFVQQLGVREVIGIVDTCNEPFAKQCRLCKIQRLASLEYRLIQNQLKPDTTHGFTPGMEPTYGVADVWKNDVDQEFSFLDNGLVFWKKEQIDTIRICDKCLGNVIRAAGNVARFTPIYHVKASEMKPILKQQRIEESQRAILFRNLTTERIRRRVREWSIRALKERRIQLLKDDEEEQKSYLERQNNVKHQEIDEKKHALVSSAMKTDVKWKLQEDAAQENRTRNLVDLALLRNFPGYDMNNPAPTTREHPLSWRLKMFAGSCDIKTDAQNAAQTPGSSDYYIMGPQSIRSPSLSMPPLSAKPRQEPYVGCGPLPVHHLASANRFGTAPISIDPRLSELQAWKKESSRFYNSIAERERTEAIERARKAGAEKEALIEYVARKQASDEVEKRRRRNAIEQAEADRLDRRLEDRLRRRAEKIQTEEAKERTLMGVEDIRSVAYLFLMREREIEGNELRRMELAERDQWAKGDRFWGIVLYEIEQVRLAELKQALWEQRVADLREMCLNVKITRPYRDEKGVFRDFEYHLPIEP